MCKAIFGTPVVPEVRRIHSVLWVSLRSESVRMSLGLQVTESSYSWIFASGAVLIGNDRIHAGRRGEVRKKLARQIGRAKNHSARDAIEFDQRQPGSQLIPCRHQH